MSEFLILLLIVIFFLINIAIGLFFVRRKDVEDFFIAKRNLGLFQSVMTINGTFIGAMTLLVYTAFVFTFGISALWIFIGYGIGFLIFSFFAVYLKRYSKDKQFYTITDYFKHRFGKRIASIVILVISIWYFGTLSAQFIGGGAVLSTLTGFSFEFSAFVMCTVIVSYLLLGGFQSVVKTDVFQFLFFFIIIFALAFSVHGGISIPADHFNFLNAGLGNIVAFLLYGIMAPFATQDFWQRIFAMKDEKIVKHTFAISAVTVLIIAVCLTYIGLIARTVYGTTISEEVAALYSFTLMVPSFLKGFVAVAFFAAILSTIDTFLFLLAVNVTNDILEIPTIDPKKRLLFLRVSIIIIGILALGLALFYPHIVDITIIFKSLGLAVAPIVIIIWFTKGNTVAITATLIVSIVFTFALSLAGFVRPELVYVSMISGFIVYGLTIGVHHVIKISRSRA
jgi:Na+/proline symporter